MEKTITVPRTFGGEIKITLKEFQKRWEHHPLEVCTFLIDHGTQDERDLGQKLVKLFPAVVERAFNKFYEEEQNGKRTSNT